MDFGLTGEALGVWKGICLTLSVVVVVWALPEPKWCPFSFPAEEEPAPPGPEAVQQSANLAEEAVERIHRTCQDAMASFSDDRNSDA